MCGIVALISKGKHGMSKAECDAFDNLLYVDALRGMDSTGVVLVDNYGDMELAKEASDANAFRKTPEYKSIMTKAFRNGSVLIGHNRAATKGSVTDENAHPFVVDDRITLVHNGTLWNHKRLANTEVDSHAIATVIHNNGDDVEAALQEIDGAYALIWHDFKNKSINIVRNAQRPMHWIETDMCWIYASEMNMIEWILARHTTLKPVGKVCMQPVGALTTFTQMNTQGEWDVKSKNLTLEKPRTYTPPAAFQPNAGSHAQQCDNTFREWGYEELVDDDGVVSYFDLKRHFGGGQGVDDVTPKEDPAPPPESKETLTQKTEKAEIRLANELGCDLSFPQFTEANERVKDDWIEAQCIEYDTWDLADTKKGYYMYAVSTAFPGFLVRIMLIKDVNEYDLLDSCLNNKKLEFKISGRSWRAFKNKANGYGLLYATATRPVLDELNLMLEC